MAWHQSRKTRRLLAAGQVTDGQHCRICGSRLRHRGAGFPVCGQPNCQRRYAARYGDQVWED